MACDTLLKIAQKCKDHFVIVQVGETTTFIEVILSTINGITCDLKAHQQPEFYEAIAHIISAQSEGIQEFIERLMLAPKKGWDDIINQANRNMGIFQNPDTVQQLVYILKVSKCLFSSLTQISQFIIVLF